MYPITAKIVERAVDYARHVNLHVERFKPSSIDNPKLLCVLRGKTGTIEISDFIERDGEKTVLGVPFVVPNVHNHYLDMSFKREEQYMGSVRMVLDNFGNTFIMSSALYPFSSFRPTDYEQVIATLVQMANGPSTPQ